MNRRTRIRGKNKRFACAWKPPESLWNDATTAISTFGIMPHHPQCPNPKSPVPATSPSHHPLAIRDFFHHIYQLVDSIYLTEVNAPPLPPQDVTQASPFGSPRVPEAQSPFAARGSPLLLGLPAGCKLHSESPGLGLSFIILGNNSLSPSGHLLQYRFAKLVMG